MRSDTIQTTLNIDRARSSGLQAAYFGAYPIASLTFAGYTLRHVGYKATFMLGLTLYGVGALLFWPAAIKRSFGGFCGATFVIGSGLGTLETAANPYLAGMFLRPYERSVSILTMSCQFAVHQGIPNSV
jgi:FHS family L-fucose permease-like MFS transporter